MRSDQDLMARSLEQVLVAQAHLQGAIRDELQQENLRFALQRIMPVSHTECALAVWAGNRYESPAGIIDEFCRRRAGESSQLFDHPLLGLNWWCMPDTCRVLVFREQLEALVKQLTGRNDARTVLQSICAHRGAAGGFSLVTFRQLVVLENGLSDTEVRQFYEYLKERYVESLSYTWCSTIVQRAEVMMKAAEEL